MSFADDKKLLSSRKSSFYFSFMYKKLSAYMSYCDDINNNMLSNGNYLYLYIVYSL